MLEYELMRPFCAFLVGVVLCQNGTYCQVLTKNPLASPTTLGIQSVILFVYLLSYFFCTYFSVEQDYLLYLMLSFHLLFGLLVYFGKKKFKNFSFSGNFIVYGLCLNLLVASIYSFMKFLYLNYSLRFPNELWFGNFRYVGQKEIWWIIVVAGLNIFYGLKNSRKIRILSIDNQFAENFIDVPRFKLNSFLMVTYTNAIITILFGYFSFLGLVFPHILRSFAYFRDDTKKEILGGGLLGGLFFAILDQFCYHITFSGAELPVGMVSSVLGPLALLLVLGKRAQHSKAFR
jgi:iron complex transport system permease protein